MMVLSEPLPSSANRDVIRKDLHVQGVFISSLLFTLGLVPLVTRGPLTGARFALTLALSSGAIAVLWVLNRAGFIRARSGQPLLSVESAAMALFVALGLTLRLRSLVVQRSLWLDEVVLALSVRDRSIIQLLSEPLLYNQSAPPGFLVTARLFAQAFGVDPIWIRAVPFISGTLLLVVAVEVACTGLRSPVARVWFVGAVSLSPVLVFYSTEMKPYSTDALATMIAIYLAARGSQHRNLRWAAILGFIGALFSLPGALVLGLLGIVALGQATNSDGLRGLFHELRERWMVWSAWAAGAGLHLLYVSVAGTDRGSMRNWWGERGGFPPSEIIGGGSLSWFGERLVELLWIALRADRMIGPGTRSLPLVTVAASVVLLFIAIRRRIRPLAGFLGLVFALAVTLAQLQIYPLSSRLALYLIPALFLLMSLGLDALTDRPSQDSRVLVGFIAAALLLVGLIESARGQMLSPYVGRDMRQLLNIVEEFALPGDRLLTVAVGSQIVEWHSSEFEIDAQLVIVDPDEVVEAERIDALGPEPPTRLWIIATHRQAQALSVFEVAEEFYDRSSVFNQDGNFLALLSNAGPVEFIPTGDRRLVRVDFD